MPENAPGAISESLKSKNFLGEHAPRPPYRLWAYANRYIPSPLNFFSNTHFAPPLEQFLNEGLTIALLLIVQRIRERLVVDFGVIKSLCGDPRLISDSCEPSMFGACKGELTGPKSHHTGLVNVTIVTKPDHSPYQAWV